jgi:hypothetical protein
MNIKGQFSPPKSHHQQTQSQHFNQLFNHPIFQQSKTIKSFIMQTSFIIATLAIFGTALAGPAPSPMGIEVIRQENGLTMVREVVSFSDTG